MGDWYFCKKKKIAVEVKNRSRGIKDKKIPKRVPTISIRRVMDPGSFAVKLPLLSPSPAVTRLTQSIGI